MEVIRAWFRRHFSDPQAVALAAILVSLLVLVGLFGRMLAPAIAGLVLAYVLESAVSSLNRYGLSHLASVCVVFVAFVLMIVFGLLAVLPLLSQQITQLVASLPSMLTTAQELLLELPERYPELIERDQVVELTDTMRSDLMSLGQGVVFYTFGSLGTLLNAAVYLFIVPFLVFFFLKDRDRLVAWASSFLPAERTLSARVWAEIDHKIGAYVRGKTYEIGIVGAAAYVAFRLIGLDFSLLLALLTGLSVPIPYIGVVGVAIPVTLVALFQFGPSTEFWMAVGAYAGIQLIDGNLLATLLISEVVDIHPVAVITAILLFGGIWGFWGVFFAVPLATAAGAILNAWPTRLAVAEAAAEGDSDAA